MLNTMYHLEEIIFESETLEQLEFSEDLLKQKKRELRTNLFKSGKNSILSKLIRSVKNDDSIADNVLDWGPRVQTAFVNLSPEIQKKSEDEQSMIEEIEDMLKACEGLLKTVHNKMRKIIWAKCPPPS